MVGIEGGLWNSFPLFSTPIFLFMPIISAHVHARTCACIPACDMYMHPCGCIYMCVSGAHASAYACECICVWGGREQKLQLVNFNLA